MPSQTAAGKTSFSVLAAATALFVLRYVARSSIDEAPRGRVAAANSGSQDSSGHGIGGTGKRHAPPHAAHESGRGREADAPTQIPARGWKDILWRVWEEIGQDRVMAVAAGVTFYGLLAIFPAIAAFVSLYGLVADPGEIEGHLAAMSTVMPGGAIQIVGEQVKRIASQGEGSLGFGFAAGLAVSLWSANAGMKAVFDALNVVYDEEEKRSFIKLNAQSLLFTVGAIIFLLTAIVATAVLPHLFDYIGLGKALEWTLAIGRWPLLLVLVVLGLAVLYRWGPSRDKAEWKWVTPGSLLAAVLWLVGSMLFSWYAANFGSYNETYGSLGAVVGFMTWMWISTIVILLGAEVNAEMEHQTAKDTTEGSTRPMGSRQATMADTLGAAKA
jgi:membrane protein